MRVLSRRSFLKTAGVAAGATAIGVAPAVAEASPEVVSEPTALDEEPLVAIVRDSRKGEVTLLSGKSETTYRDPALVKRLLKAASRGSRGGVA